MSAIFTHSMLKYTIRPQFEAMNQALATRALGRH
jgi:hypothetical protein